MADKEAEESLPKNFNWVGTYVMTNRFYEMSDLENSRQSDNYVILYLRQDSKFLMLGFWDGYEYSIAAGDWDFMDDQNIELMGRYLVRSDTVRADSSRSYSRVLRLACSGFTPMLRAEYEIQGASLLGLVGTLSYLGKELVFKPHQSSSLPSNNEEIEQFLRDV